MRERPVFRQTARERRVVAEEGQEGVVVDGEVWVGESALRLRGVGVRPVVRFEALLGGNDELGGESITEGFL